MPHCSCPANNYVLTGHNFRRLVLEASSLDGDSYLVEVGVALWAAPDEPILGWSALIRLAGR